MRGRICLFGDRDAGSVSQHWQHPWASQGRLGLFFSFFHTNFKLPFKFWEVFFYFYFYYFSLSLFKILFSPFMLVPLSPHPASTCWSQLFDFGLELVTWKGNVLPHCSLLLPNSLWRAEPDAPELFGIQSWSLRWCLLISHPALVGQTQALLNLGLSWNLCS